MNYLCNQRQSPPLKLWVRILIRRGVLIQHYVIKFVSDLRQVSGFLGILHRKHNMKRSNWKKHLFIWNMKVKEKKLLNFIVIAKHWPPWYNWHIVESGINHHKPKLIWKKEKIEINIVTELFPFDCVEMYISRVLSNHNEVQQFLFFHFHTNSQL
jgi:hypothetical protein